jgi:protein involved in polysaccharide export with SLBB domain
VQRRSLVLAITLVALSFVSASTWAVGSAAIAPGDTIKITVVGEPDQSKQVVVDPDGRVC